MAEINSTEVIIQPIVPKAVDNQQVIVYIPTANTGSYGVIKLETDDLNPDVIAPNGIIQLRNGRVLQITEAKLNENIVKDPSKTYLVWKGDKFPNRTIATFKAPAGCTIDWGDGTVETFETASTEVNTHTYTDGFEYHLISLSNYTAFSNDEFYGCSGLKSVTIGNSVTSIGDNAFSGCDGLISIIIPDSVTSIGDNAFFGCSGLTSVTIPNSVTGIGYQAFHNCSSLTSVTIPDSVTTISSSTFSGCSGLTSVTIGNSVRNIGSSAFDGCSSLTSVTIPDSVTFMGDYAFSGCSGLKTVKISAINPPTLGSNAFETSLEKIIVPKSSIDAYKSAAGWSTYADKIVYEVDSSDIDLIAPSAALNIKNGEGQYSLVQKVAPSTTTDPNNYAKGKEAVALGRYNKTYGDRSMTVNYDNENYGKWSFVANTKNKNGSKDVAQENVQSNAMFGCANEIKVGIEGLVAGKSNVNYEGDRFDISGSENENYTNNVRMSGWKNKSLKEIKTPITSGGGGGGSTNPDTNPTEPTQPYDYTNNTGYADISGTENKVFAMGGRTRGVAGICYSPFGSTEGFWTKAGYLVEDTTKSTETEKYYKPQGLGAKAFGRATHAKEDFTIAGGEHSVALKKGANAIGYYTTANTEWGTAIGKYNVGKTNSLFEVGNGYAVFDAGRKNAFEVLQDGRAKVQSAPTESNDVLRLNEFSVLTQKQVDLLF